MRVLCCSTPMEGVFGPLVPLARAWRDRGDAVLVAVGPDLLERVKAVGLDGVAAGPSAMDAAMATLGDPDGATAAGTHHWMFGAVLFGTALAPDRFVDLGRTADRWKPDLIVHATVDVAAPIVAAARNVPSMSYGLGLVPPEAFVAELARRVAPLWERAGVAPPDDAGLYGLGYFDPCPTGLQLDRGAAAPVARPVRPALPGDPADELPSWFAALGSRPIVYVSLGTVPLFNQPATFARLVGDLGDTDADVVVTVGELNDPEAVGTVPGNVHLEQWLPLAPLLPHCDGVVGHAGAGTTLASLRCGLPSVLVPQGADQFEMAAACSAAGVATILDIEGLTSASVRDAVVDLLADRAMEDRASDLAAEIAAMPSAAEALPART
jgi:UDP:flavonoid glycosyltransferase YjiC (YdhE family)